MRKAIVFILIIVGIMTITGFSLNTQEVSSFAIQTIEQAGTVIKNGFGTILNITGNKDTVQVNQSSVETDVIPVEATAAPAPTPSPSPTPSPTPEPTPTPVPEPEPYTMAWLDKYAPASVAPFEEQIGDNGVYTEVTNYPPSDTYKLIVDYYNQCVYAYEKNEYGFYTKLVRVMICTTGGNGNWTPEGTYNMGKDRVRFGLFTEFDCYAQYWSQMMGSFYFHSILYGSKDADSIRMSSYNNLGKPGSHGCIRLLVPDARWIYENCAPETLCVVSTDFEKDEKLKTALKEGYKGAIDYTGEDAVEDDAEG